MEVCKELKDLSKEFNKLGHKLYIVGGYVRDDFLGLPKDDIDIASSLSAEKVIKICNKLKLKTTNINSHLGTVLIKYNNYKFEYTCFRKESYSVPGTHTPEDVEFVDDIAVDCKRRDFSINSMYYDIENNIVVDLVRGQKDLQRKIIRTTMEPHLTLADDGLRILRAVRFASTLGFCVENKTLKALKVYVPYLNKISKERILAELKLISVADLKYGNENKLFLRLCNDLNLPQYLFNSALSRMSKFSKSDIKSYYSLSKDSRLIGFYVLVLKNYHRDFIDSVQLGYNINMLLGKDGIKESVDNVLVTEKIYRIYQNLIYEKDSLNATVNYLTLSDNEREIIDMYLNKKAKKELSVKKEYIKNKNMPLSVHQLDVTASDLIECGIERMFISKILSTLYNQVLNISVPNEKKELIALAKEINETFNKLKELS